MAEKKSFMQFSYCKICRINHNKGTKHAKYSTKHKRDLKIILDKFCKKIKNTKQSLINPTISRVRILAETSKFWCYFCDEEFDRDLRLDDYNVDVAGIVLHIASVVYYSVWYSTDHKQKMLNFWRENFLEKNKMEDFVVLEEDCVRLKEKIMMVITDLEHKRSIEIKEAAAVIGHTDECRRRLHSAVLTAQRQEQEAKRRFRSSKGSHITSRGTQGSMVGGGVGSVVGGGAVRTVSAHGEGLTYIGAPKYLEGRGNIHSGAQPPWLTSCDEISVAGAVQQTIGPTEEAWNKQLKEKKKAKLPAGRVGAGFDRRGNVADNWLPSFGRVWSKSSRTHSVKLARRFLMKRMQDGNKRTVESLRTPTIESPVTGSNHISALRSNYSSAAVKHVGNMQGYNGQKGQQGNTSAFNITTGHVGLVGYQRRINTDASSSGIVDSSSNYLNTSANNLNNGLSSWYSAASSSSAHNSVRSFRDSPNNLIPHDSAVRYNNSESSFSHYNGNRRNSSSGYREYHSNYSSHIDNANNSNERVLNNGYPNNNTAPGANSYSNSHRNYNVSQVQNNSIMRGNINTSGPVSGSAFNTGNTVLPGAYKRQQNSDSRTISAGVSLYINPNML